MNMKKLFDQPNVHKNCNIFARQCSCYFSLSCIKHNGKKITADHKDIHFQNIKLLCRYGPGPWRQWRNDSSTSVTDFKFFDANWLQFGRKKCATVRVAMQMSAASAIEGDTNPNGFVRNLHNHITSSVYHSEIWHRMALTIDGIYTACKWDTSTPGMIITDISGDHRHRCVESMLIMSTTLSTLSAS